MEDVKEKILVKNKVSLKRFYWYLLGFFGVAIFAIYLRYSMNSYRSRGLIENTTKELLERSFRSDGALPFVALVIPVMFVVAFFIVRGFSKTVVVVTDERIYGKLFSGLAYNIPLENIYIAKKTSSTTISVVSTTGTVNLYMLANCDEICETLKNKKIEVISFSDIEKKERCNKLQTLSNEALISTVSRNRAIIWVAHILLPLYAVWGFVCILYLFIPSFLSPLSSFLRNKNGFLVLAITVILTYLIKKLRISDFSKDAEAVLMDRIVNEGEKKKMKASLKKKRYINVIVCICVIAVLNMAVSGIGSIYEESKNNTGSSGVVTCKSCGREFKYGTENSKSIRKTNMCKNCYNNFKWGQQAVGNW